MKPYATLSPSKLPIQNYPPIVTPIDYIPYKCMLKLMQKTQVEMSRVLTSNNTFTKYSSRTIEPSLKIKVQSRLHKLRADEFGR